MRTHPFAVATGVLSGLLAGALLGPITLINLLGVAVGTSAGVTVIETRGFKRARMFCENRDEDGQPVESDDGLQLVRYHPGEHPAC